jgi:hypothetical protein
MKVTAHREFRRNLKELAKRHASIVKDIDDLIESLIIDPTQGDALGGGLYKVRLNIRSKGKGKSGGGRVITYIKIEDEIHLLMLFDKSDFENVSDSFLEALVKTIE